LNQLAIKPTQGIGEKSMYSNKQIDTTKATAQFNGKYFNILGRKLQTVVYPRKDGLQICINLFDAAGKVPTAIEDSVLLINDRRGSHIYVGISSYANMMLALKDVIKKNA
jgi:hypothetical protein